MEQGGFGAYLVAEAAFLAELGEKAGGGGFAEDEGEETQAVAFIGVAAGGVPGEGELKLVGGAVFDDFPGGGFPGFLRVSSARRSR